MSWLRRHLDVLLFAAGITAMVFLAGMIVGRLGLFPWPALYSAKEAALDLRDNWRHYLGIRSMYELDSRRAEGGVTIHDQALAFDGYTLVAAYRSDHPGRYDAYLLDMDGKIVHQWDTYFRHIWPVEVRPDLASWDGSVEIHGAYMYPNGDLLVDLGGAGTAKLDRCSKVLWSSERHTHHNVEPMPDGGVITPSKIRREEEAPDERPYVGLGPAGFYDDDTVLLLNPDGSIRHEESVIDILYRSGWQSVLFSRPGTARRFEEEDPIHLNDAEVLTAELASAFPMFKAGDIMLSLRNPNTLMVVDPETWTAKWVMTGPFLGQHDPARQQQVVGPAQADDAGEQPAQAVLGRQVQLQADRPLRTARVAHVGEQTCVTASHTPPTQSAPRRPCAYWRFPIPSARWTCPPARRRCVPTRRHRMWES